MKRGEQKRFPIPPDTHHRHFILRAYDWADDTIAYTLAERTNTTTFMDSVVQLLLDYYPADPIVLVMDNPSYHMSAATRALLSLFDHRVLVLCLPPYCSHLNPINAFGGICRTPYRSTSSFDISHCCSKRWSTLSSSRTICPTFHGSLSQKINRDLLRRFKVDRALFTPVVNAAQWSPAGRHCPGGRSRAGRSPPAHTSRSGCGIRRPGVSQDRQSRV